MLCTPICREVKGYGWYLISPFLLFPHPHNFCLPLQYPFSTSLWWCSSPATITEDPISQLSCPWMERGPAGGCPADTKGQDWQVRTRVATQSSLNWDICLSEVFRTSFWVRALNNKFTWSTLDLLPMQGQFECLQWKSTDSQPNGQRSDKWDFRDD